MLQTFKRSLIVLGIMAMSALPLRAQTIVAHRGASHDAPENTLSAFRLAWQQGADGIEGDFYVTQDQQLVCLHDKDTLRTGGQKLDVATSTLAQLRSLEYGAWKDPKFNGEPIPTFSEVLSELPAGKLFVIELKTGPEIAPLIKECLDSDAKARGDRHLLFISFHADTIAKCKELLPKVRAHWLTGFKIDKQTGVCTPDAATICRTVAETQADGVGVQGKREQLRPEFVAQLKQGGCREFHVWTIDEPADARYFQKLGAVGITTNRPAVIRESLATQ
jgi:glycerophosphoryl diester phosphodiesterase